MSARTQFPELDRITRGVGVLIIEDAEQQAADALDEIDKLRAALVRCIDDCPNCRPTIHAARSGQ